MTAYPTETYTAPAPVPIPRPRPEGAGSASLRPASMLTLEESDYELPPPPSASYNTPPGAGIPRSYSPLGRQRYSQYGTGGLAGSPSGTPLLESLLDSSTGANLPLPQPQPQTPQRGSRRPGSFGAGANAASETTSNKRSSWYSTVPFSFGSGPAIPPGSPTPAAAAVPTLKDMASGDDMLADLPPPPMLNVEGFENDGGTGGTGNPPLAPPPAPPFAMTVSKHRLGHSAQSSVSSMASFQSAVNEPAGPPGSHSPLLRPKSPAYQPFNFQSTTLDPAGANASARPAQRRGHRYKHSSVSMNFFREDVRAPLAIPASLQIPNLAECFQSMSKEQKVRITWGAFHFFIAFLVYMCESPFTAVSALAHLLFYDAMGALMCAVVDILGNFDVWKRSSIHLPFGLERAEVLAGFALSILLIFMGGDIMSHWIQEVVGALYGGEEVHAHGHSHNHGGQDATLHWTSIIIRVFLAIIVTIVSAVGLENHARISKALRNSGQAPAFSYLPWILSNPSHFITVAFSAVILVFPSVTDSTRRVIDTILTPCIAGSMCYMGWMLAKSLGGMMVMSFPGENRIDLVDAEVRKLPGVISVSNIRVWQVHHSAWLACMNVVMTGSAADEQTVREQASRLIQDIMGAADDGYDEENKLNSKASMTGLLDQTRWETTIDIARVPGSSPAELDPARKY